jgi:hypothetical protein
MFKAKSDKIKNALFAVIHFNYEKTQEIQLVGFAYNFTTNYRIIQNE